MEGSVDVRTQRFLAAMARRYMWDQSEAEALADTGRIIRRVMDLGTLDDVLALEPAVGRDRLIATLRGAPVGSLRPRSWWFWHYRLGLADAERDPPPMPVRCLG